MVKTPYFKCLGLSSTSSTSFVPFGHLGLLITPVQCVTLSFGISLVKLLWSRNQLN